MQRLWTSETVAKLKLYNQEAFDHASNYGEQSDILRYELLYLYGGVYVDTDMQAVRPLDDLCKVRRAWLGY